MKIPMIWLCVCAAVGMAADPVRRERDVLRLGPKPPVERFPSTPYVAPPTPEEKAAAKLHAEELIAARKAHRAAVTNLLASVGVDASPTADPATIKERARVISNVADVLRRNPSMMKDVREAAPEGGGLARGK